MSEQIQVVGLTTTDVSEGVQYTLLTQTGGKYYDYVFTPNARGKYILRTNPTVDKNIEMQPLAPMTLQWDGKRLLLTQQKPVVLFDLITRTFLVPTEFFHHETDILPKRLAMIVNGASDAVMPFIATGKSVVYADEWEHLPGTIPEDVIVLNVKKFPIPEIVLRLPQRTKAVVVNPEILE